MLGERYYVAERSFLMTEQTLETMHAEQVMVTVTGIENDQVDLQKLIAHIVQRMSNIEAAVFAKQEEADESTAEAPADE